MASNDGGGRSVLRAGCIGCGAVTAIVAIVVAVVVGIAFMRSRSEEVRDRVLQPTVPTPAATGTDRETPGAGPEPGTLVLDVHAAEFNLRRAASGESLHVDARYDEKAFVLQESLRSTDDDTGGWVYQVSLEPLGSPLMTMIKQAFSSNDPKLDVYVPRDVPMTLRVSMDAGGGIAELGGLWIRSADLRMEKGGVVVDFDEPLVEPMESFTVRAEMGGFVVGHLGNASPRRVEIRARMGGGDVDLRGAWTADADLDLSWHRGGLSVRLPRDAGVTGLDPDAHGRWLREADPGEPTLTFTLDGKLDDLDLDR